MSSLYGLARAAVQHLDRGIKDGEGWCFALANRNANAIYTKHPTEQTRAWLLAVGRVRRTPKTQQEAAIAALWPPPNFDRHYQDLTRSKRERRGPSVGASPRLTSGDDRAARASKILFLWAQGQVCRADACAWLRQVGAKGIWPSWHHNDGIELRDHWRSPWAVARNARLNDYDPTQEAPRLAQELWGETARTP